MEWTRYGYCDWQKRWVAPPARYCWWDANRKHLGRPKKVRSGLSSAVAKAVDAAIVKIEALVAGFLASNARSAAQHTSVVV